MKLNREQKAIVVVVTGVVVFALVFWLAYNDEETIYRNNEPVKLTPENLPIYLSSLEIVDDLPSDGKINLNIGDLNYKITRGDVEIGSFDEADVVVDLPENYLEKLGYGVCSTIKEAMKKKEIVITTNLPSTEILWKYKKLLKYRDCIS